MPRFRRYRVFLVSAAIILILLFQVGRNSDWEPPSSLYKPASNADKKVEAAQPPKKDQAPVKSTFEKSAPEKSTSQKSTQFQDEPVPKKEQEPVKIPTLKAGDYGKGYGLPTATLKRTSTSTKAKVATPTPKEEKVDQAKTTPTPAAIKTPAAVDIPDRVEAVEKTSSTSTTSALPSVIHWEKQEEFFPVPTESLIRLPTGKPKAIPTIQHVFGSEPEPAKEKREKRLAKVKTEAEKAWAGYKKYAWTHDEVQPVSKQPRDPFCGWAATLVDSLDTLWIMGLKTEFEDAVKAVGEIDFTTSSHRSEIPVFETIIRYLGGLLAAYDVSEAKYTVLLDKALELAEILIGVFDTPNRMPILYYGWKPAVASQPHKASTTSSVAELGSMSMEFTRLAQLTGQDRFYDAIARITDAFEEWQNREKSTALPGIFPQNVDASGCNRTALNIKVAEERSAAAKLQEEEAKKLAESSPVGYEGGKTEVDGTTEARSRVADTQAKSGGFTTKDAFSKMAGETQDKTRAKRDAVVTSNATLPVDGSIPVVKSHYTNRAPPLTATGLTADFDCPSQGLVPTGYGESYSMGGSQDSAYEYYPKQYLLLGGLEPKYRTMHEKTVAAVKKYLLFRPMIEDESRDLLFSAKAMSSDGTDRDLTYDYEVTHLTCFLGGMFGLGGKIFGSEEDVEIGKKLADGCAWAYEIMPTGIMPEYSGVMPCKSVSNCKFNETAWFERLDPNQSWRTEQMADWVERHAAWEEEVKEIKELQKEAEKEKGEKKVLKTPDEEKRVATTEEGKKSRPVNDTLPSEMEKDKKPTEYELRSENSEALQIKKRAAIPIDEKVNETKNKGRPVDNKVEELASQINFNDPSGHTDSGLGSDDQTTLADDYELPAEPVKPQTHEEYVKEKLERQQLPKGFVQMNDKRYILR